ncbi:alpha/beta hydrolase family protein [Campylobacter blaseri]|uniref:BD-FAE-like domain-containing protein n=1 Tax=Campylobacter blaseri TaxID=2042961 RepID=A0A2P8R0D2_9BACT|nr:alpha/beta hydrolase fold domain-containing protein [Campylobacter blaseri]PSM51942.1 hypothetical protein CQ405_05090 [Campylobacter blaseri]PSM53726.1 hypothetical protein CRN67_05090 [Campylobacter blaseri]QKF85719.1 alpha/beta hydrolase family protein [Campylobacter blaseri]
MKKIILTVVAVVAILISGCSKKNPDINMNNQMVEVEKVVYGEDKDQFYNIHIQNMKDPDKIIVLVHGGYWRSKYNLDHLNDLMSYLINKSFNVASVEYRRGVENQWPIPYNDVSLAINDIKKRYKNAKIITIGHSVGGQLVLLTENLVDGVIALSPVTDVYFGYKKNLGDNNAAKQYFKDHSYKNLLKASPSNYKLKAGKNVLVVHGKNDDSVLIETSDKYVKNQSDYNVNVDYLRLANMPHMEMIDSKNSHWEFIISWIEKQ